MLKLTSTKAGESLNRKNYTALYKGYDLSVRITHRSTAGHGRFARTTVAIAAAAFGQVRSSWQS
jgi:hypothetical protein